MKHLCDAVATEVIVVLALFVVQGAGRDEDPVVENEDEAMEL